MKNHHHPTHISVLGAGSWGTAVSILLARNGFKVTLWGQNAQQMEQMQTTRYNQRYLGNALLPESIHCSSDLIKALTFSSNWMIAIPSIGLPQLIENIKSFWNPDTVIGLLTKGLSPEAKPLDQWIKCELQSSQLKIAVISGPTFAKEVAEGKPGAITVAADHHEVATTVSNWLHGKQIRAYTSSDVLGVELGGSLKNVLAIATGIADGLKMGSNARTALITRGLAELSRLYQQAGARQETLMGLAGLGDLVLTCTDDQSRNRRLGLALGRGDSLSVAINGIDQTIEGITTAQTVIQLGQNYCVELPICETVHRILYENMPIAHAVDALLKRAPKAESDF